MIGKTRQLLYLSAACLLLSCTTASQQAFTKAVHERPEKRLASYPFDPKSSLLSRVRSAPDFLISYLKAIDKKEAYAPYLPVPEEMAMIAQYLEKLPPLHKQVLQERLAGIYFVNTFWGSGMADYVLDDHDDVYAIMILNPETMRHDMSDWMSWRESTIFKQDDPSVRIAVECGAEYTGLMYALLHETTHIVDYVRNYTPYTDPDMKLLGRARPETEFVKEVWEDVKRPVPQYDVPARKDITVYGFNKGPHLSARNAVQLYVQLSRTPFTSLVSWTAWPEDLAEYVTWYYYRNVLKQPYSVTVFVDDKAALTFSPFSSGRTAGPRADAVRDMFIVQGSGGE